MIFRTFGMRKALIVFMLMLAPDFGKAQYLKDPKDISSEESVLNFFTPTVFPLSLELISEAIICTRP